MPEKKEVEHVRIHVKDKDIEVTHIPTATSGMWFTLHDAFDVWAAVSIDLDGTVVGWQNEPPPEWTELIVKAIRQAWDIPEPPEYEDKEEGKFA